MLSAGLFLSPLLEVYAHIVHFQNWGSIVVECTMRYAPVLLLINDLLTPRSV